MRSKNERNCQINITGIERNLAKLTEHDNEGRIYINKETHTGNISSLRLKTDNDIVDGIYLITVYPGNGSHAIVLQISNNGKSFDVFEPNGKKLVNFNNFYTLKVYVNKKQINKLKTSLSPNHDGLNNSGICGIWSIIISILLHGIVKKKFTEEDKKLFYDFLNDDIEGAIEFIQHIKTNFFDGTKQYQSTSEVNTFLEDIRDLLREIIDKQQEKTPKIVEPPRRSNRLKGGKKSRKSSTSRSKFRGKSRSKSRRKSRRKSLKRK